MDNLMMTFGSAICFQSLLEAIEKGTNEEAKLHLQSIEEPSGSPVDSTKLTLLHYAAKCRNASMVQYLISLGCDVNAVDDSGFTPLMLAVQNSDVTTVAVLLDNDANIFTERSILQLALYHAVDSLFVSGDQNLTILEMIYEKISKSSVSQISTFILRSSELEKFIIVVFGNEDSAKIMLSSGYYPIDFQEPAKGFTALHCAMIFARAPNVKLLIKHGANIRAVNNIGLTPLRYYTYQLESIDNDSDVLQSLLRGNIDLYLPDENDSTEVEYLLRYGNEKTRRTVLDFGIKAIMKMSWLLQDLEKLKISYLLLQYGLDPQQINYRGMPLIQFLYETLQYVSVALSFLDHIALIAVSDDSRLTDRIRNVITSTPQLKDHFDVATKSLKSMGDVIIYESVTVLALLIKSDTQLVAYARNPTLRVIFKNMIGMEQLMNSEYYYWSLLRKRLRNAIDRVDFEEKVALTIQQLTGLNADVYQAIVHKILSYLSMQDLNNLCRVGNYM